MVFAFILLCNLYSLTWFSLLVHLRLTTFVVRSFVSAQQYIFIDDNVVNEAIRFIVEQQEPDGSFEDHGRVIHTGMKGGVENRPALTAYVITALCQVKHSVSI